MKTKRILALLLALVMLFALAACGESKAAGDSALKESLESAANEAKAEAAPAAEAAPEPTPEPGIELPPPDTAPEPEPIPAQQVYTIRPEVLAGLLKTSPEAAAESGGQMQPDSAQLTVPPPEKPPYTVPILCTALGAFALGFVYEIIRFRRLKQQRTKHKR